MTKHEHWTHRLTEYVDGDLSQSERDDFEAHARECPDCREAVQEIRTIVAAARALGPIEPPRDLWPVIARAMGPRPGVAPRPDVIALPTGREERRTDGFYLSLPQLAAAAVVLMMISVAATLAVGPGFASGGPRSAATAPAEGPMRPAAAPLGVEPSLAEEVTALEEGLAVARDRLDAGTVRIIEKNLSVIERAIEDSRRALALDPENAFLREHLDRAFEQKRDYLQEATRIVEWAG